MHRFDALFDFEARGEEFPPAADAAQAEIHADAQHLKGVTAAGVRLAHLQTVAHLYIHGGIPLSVIL